MDAKQERATALTPKLGRTGVDARVRVQLAVAVDLRAAHQDRLDPDQLRDGERQAEAQVLRAVQLHLAGVHPARRMH